MVSIACLDPASESPQSRQKSNSSIWNLRRLLTDSGGSIRLRPSGAGMDDEVETDEDLDGDLLDLFPEKLATIHPPAPAGIAGKNPRLAHGRPWLRRPRGAHPADPARPRRAKRAQGPDPRRPALVEPPKSGAPSACAVPLADHSDGVTAAGSFQFFSIRNPDRLDLRILRFNKTPEGWFWTPEPSPEIASRFQDWTDEQAGQSQFDWQAVLLNASPVVALTEDADAPSEDDARRLISAWLEAVQADDVPAALRLTARLDGPQSGTTLLRNLGYEMAAPGGAGRQAHITAIHREISGPPSRLKPRTTARRRFLLSGPRNPVGPRILLEMDLFASASRSRDFLNRESLKRLRNTNPAAAATLKTLFTRYRDTQPTGPPLEERVSEKFIITTSIPIDNQRFRAGFGSRKFKNLVAFV